MPIVARCSQLLFVLAQVLPVSFTAPLAAAQSSRTLVIATREVPPFAMQRPDSSWHGISIDLWHAIAEDLDLTFRFEAMGLDEMIDAVADGSAGRPTGSSDWISAIRSMPPGWPSRCQPRQAAYSLNYSGHCSPPRSSNHLRRSSWCSA